MSSKIKVSVYDFLVHETRAVLRKERASGTPLTEIALKLAELKDKDARSLSKYSTLLIAGAIAINALDEGGVLEIQTSILDINVPKIYAVFACVTIWAAILFKSFSTLQLIVHIALAEQIFDARFLSVRLQHLGHSMDDFHSPQRNGHFVKHSPVTKLIIGSPLLLIFVAVMLPGIGAYFYLLSESWTALVEPSDVFMAKVLAVAALGLLLVPLPYTVLYFTKFPIVKDIGFIRWNFLARLKRTQNNFRGASGTKACGE
ncbi:hypothetical protein [Cognatishimia maritima]|uniref:Uncharacterized protein n=1 Tax=Cognatishimia maritima TaxID=870908 RepID=A0A1M5U489_9RHOB|nr:hypothetical protein [Cognatishimia maritima]SHH57847.1 hypothetical protein SAMN04488044_2790 [Cognatishimia maritima]